MITTGKKWDGESSDIRELSDPFRQACADDMRAAGIVIAEVFLNDLLRAWVSRSLVMSRHVFRLSAALALFPVNTQSPSSSQSARPDRSRGCFLGQRIQAMMRGLRPLFVHRGPCCHLAFAKAFAASSTQTLQCDLRQASSCE